MEFIREFRPTLLMQSTPTVLVTVHFNSGSCISEGDKDVFWNHDQHLEVVLLFPQKAEALKGIHAVLGFPKLKIVKTSDTRWLSHERWVKTICKELPPLLQTLSQLYESSGDAEAYGIYSLLASVNGVSSEVTFEGVTYSSLAIINKEELLGKRQVFKRAVFQEKKVMMEKNTSPPSLQDIKKPWKQLMLVYSLELL